MIEVLPCKKCGYLGSYRLLTYLHNDMTFSYKVSCTKCGYCTKDKLTREEAYAAWNQRDRIKGENNE